MTPSDTSTAGVTVSVVLPTRSVPGTTASIVVLPTAALVARPSLPLATLMLATVDWVELQVTAVVRSCVVLSLNVPVAVNCTP